jgi:hypothetical protein
MQTGPSPLDEHGAQTVEVVVRELHGILGVAIDPSHPEWDDGQHRPRVIPLERYFERAPYTASLTISSPLPLRTSCTERHRDRRERDRRAPALGRAHEPRTVTPSSTARRTPRDRTHHHRSRFGRPQGGVPICPDSCCAFDRRTLWVVQIVAKVPASAVPSAVWSDVRPELQVRVA